MNGMIRRVYGVVDSHTFGLLSMRAKNEGMKIGEVLTGLIRMYCNGEISFQKHTEKKTEQHFNYVKEVRK